MLAEHGSRGLTHGQVDRYAELPDGTTSYYYRTRAALLRGVGKRVADIDVANLQSVIDEPPDPLSPFAHLARLTIMQSDGPGLTLNRARHELLLGAARDPDLAETSQEFVARINAMAQDAIAHLQPGTDDPGCSPRKRRPSPPSSRACSPGSSPETAQLAAPSNSVGYWRRSPPRAKTCRSLLAQRA